MANEWDDLPLKDWGVPKVDFGNEDESTTGLPTELDGIDLVPDDLEKLQGDDETEMKHLIICYKDEDIEYLCSLLGLSSIDKVVYKCNELK